jgi:hypothetical protein
MGKIVQINKETVDKEVYDDMVSNCEKLSEMLIHKQAELNALATIIAGISEVTGESQFVLPISILQLDGGDRSVALAKNDEDSTITVKIIKGSPILTQESDTVQ